MNPYASVTEFHVAFGQLVATRPSLPSRDIRQLRIKLLHEEYTEFFDANDIDDIVEIADALADMAYILCGTATSYGVVPTGTDFANFNRTFDLAPMLPGEVKRSEMARILREAFEVYLSAEKSDVAENIGVALNCLREDLEVVASAHMIPLGRVFAEVHRSNMSKLGPDGVPLLREDGKIMKPPTFSKPDLAKVLFG